MNLGSLKHRITQQTAKKDTFHLNHENWCFIIFYAHSRWTNNYRFILQINIYQINCVMMSADCWESGGLPAFSSAISTPHVDLVLTLSCEVSRMKYKAWCVSQDVLEINLGLHHSTCLQLSSQTGWVDLFYSDLCISPRINWLQHNSVSDKHLGNCSLAIDKWTVKQ